VKTVPVLRNADRAVGVKEVHGRYAIERLDSVELAKCRKGITPKSYAEEPEVKDEAIERTFKQVASNFEEMFEKLPGTREVNHSTADRPR
jgi:hypothetical protein